MQAFVDGESAELTPTEFASRTRLPVSRAVSSPATSSCSGSGGGARSHRDRTVDVFVRKLREKIDRRAPNHTFIHTRYGVGYKLEALPK